MSAKEVYRVVLSSKKIVLLRPLQIKDQDLACKAVGNRSGENQNLFGVMLQKELLKMLIVQVDGKAPAAAELESLDELFTYGEYMQLLQVIKKLSGADELGEPEVAIDLSGSK